MSKANKTKRAPHIEAAIELLKQPAATPVPAPAPVAEPAPDAHEAPKDRKGWPIMVGCRVRVLSPHRVPVHVPGCLRVGGCACPTRVPTRNGVVKSLSRNGKGQDVVEVTEFETFNRLTPSSDQIEVMRGATQAHKRHHALATGGKRMESEREPKVPKVGPVGTCPCCSGTSKGGFIPGHDAKLASRLRRIIAGDGEEAKRTLVASILDHPAVQKSAHLGHLIEQAKVAKPAPAPQVATPKSVAKPKGGKKSSKAKPKAGKATVIEEAVTQASVTVGLDALLQAAGKKKTKKAKKEDK